MSKRKKDDAVELETATDVQDAAGAAEAVDAADAGAGQAGESSTRDAAAGDEVATDAAAAGEVPGTADAVADAADDAQREAAGEAAALDHVHEPAAYEAFPEIIAVEFEDFYLTVKLADGQYFSVAYADVDFLAGADAQSRRDVDIAPLRLSWPALDAGMTVDRLLARSFSGNVGDDLLCLAGVYVREVETDPTAPRNWMDINVLAAYSAASLAFGTTEEDTTTLPRFDVRWLVQERGDRAQAAALCAAGFLRRDAAVLVQPETLAIHLRRSGFADMPAAEGRAAVAWKVFAFALAELDALDRAEADARRRAEQVAEAGQGPRPVRRLGLALQRRDANPLTELGRRLQRDA